MLTPTGAGAGARQPPFQHASSESRRRLTNHLARARQPARASRAKLPSPGARLGERDRRTKPSAAGAARHPPAAGERLQAAANWVGPLVGQATPVVVGHLAGSAQRSRQRQILACQNCFDCGILVPSFGRSLRFHPTNSSRLGQIRTRCVGARQAVFGRIGSVFVPFRAMAGGSRQGYVFATGLLGLAARRNLAQSVVVFA